MSGRKSRREGLHPWTMSLSINVQHPGVHQCSATGSVFIQISSCVIRDFTDWDAHKIISSSLIGPIEWIGVSCDKHSLESELNVEEIQALLDLVNRSEGLCDFGRNGYTRVCKQFEDTRGSYRINAIVQCLGFWIWGDAKQTKDKRVSWLFKKLGPDIFKVDYRLRINIAALEIR